MICNQSYLALMPNCWYVGGASMRGRRWDKSERGKGGSARGASCFADLCVVLIVRRCYCKSVTFAGIWTLEYEYIATWVQLLRPLGHECSYLRMQQNIYNHSLLF